MALVWTLLADVRTRCLLFAVALFLSATGTRAAVVEVTSLPPPLTNAPAPPPSAKFLFIFETSAAMKRFEHEGRQVVFDLVYSGISNQMHSADTYGVWTFNEQVSAGLIPMQVWSSESSLDQASKIGVFLKSERYRGKPRADLAIAKALSVVKTVKDVNVVLVMSGDSSLGTSELEVKLRDTYQRKAELARQQKVPVVLTFCSTDGEIALASLTLAGERIQLREDLLAKARQPIKKPAPAPAVVAQITPVTNHVRAPIIMIGQPKPTAPVAAAPATTSASGTEPNTLAATTAPALPAPVRTAETQTTNALSQQTPSTVPGVASTLNEQKMDSKSTTTVSAHPEKESGSTLAKAVVEPPTPAPGERSKPVDPASSNHRLSDLLPTPLKVAAREPEPVKDNLKPNTSSAVVAVIPPVKSSSDARWIMFLGASFFAVALGLSAWAIYRLRQSRQTSYISRAMTRR